MPRTDVVLSCEDDVSVPLLEWLDGLSPRARLKCLARVERLRELGHELRRPEADYLREDVYELRAKHAGIDYRILYFFYGRIAIVLSHGFSKQQARVPKGEIERAVKRKSAFEADPARHTYRGK